MLSHEKLTRKDRIAILQKLTPVSFSRVYRTCKWVNQLIEDNEGNIHIHTEKALEFSLRWTRPSNISNFKHVFKIQSKSGEEIEEIPFMPTELKSLLSEAPYQFFVFRSVAQLGDDYVLIDDNADILEGMTTLRTRNLLFPWLNDGPLPALNFTYETLEIGDIMTQTFDPFFDLSLKPRNVVLHFAAENAPVCKIVKRCCELMQEMIEGKDVVSGNTWCVFRRETTRPEALDRFLGEKGSRAVDLAEGVLFHLIPLSQHSFLAVKWLKDNATQYDSLGIVRISSKSSFYDYCKKLIDGNYHGDIPPSEEEIHGLADVQEICSLFFR